MDVMEDLWIEPTPAQKSPCVSTNVGDVTNLIGKAGIVVPPNDPNALKAGILDLCGLSENQRRNLWKR